MCDEKNPVHSTILKNSIIGKQEVKTYQESAALISV